MTEIAFRAVRLTRGDTHVLKGVDLDVAQGETLALVGRSGAGKSTILKLINRLLEPDSGEVTVRDRLVSASGTRSICGGASATSSRMSASFPI